MQAFANEWMTMDRESRLNLTPAQLRYFTQEEFLKMLKKKILHKDKKYLYMVTFTLDPAKHDIDQELEDQVTQFVEAQAERKPLQILYFAYAKEYTKAGAPHWHCAIETAKCLKKDRFQYYVKTYGNIDISKTKGTTLQEALNYISKDSIPVVLKHL